MRPLAKPVALYLAIAAVAVALFLLLPGLDLGVSRLFYVQGQGFPLAGSIWVRPIEDAVPWLTRLTIAVAAVGALWLALIGRPLWRLDRKSLIFLVAALALGPGLAVNTALKDHWGRARPYQIEQFGGPRQFTPAPLPATQCERNCAFVSGHAALGFSMIGFALLLPSGAWRRRAIGGALVLGAVIGLARIAAGRHFLSDVVYAGLITVGISWLLYQAIVVRDLLAGPMARRLYRATGRGLAELHDMATHGPPSLRAGLAVLLLLLAETILVPWVDRPLAWYLRDAAAPLRPFFDLAGRLGWGTPYLVLFAASFAALYWGGAFPRLRPWAGQLRALAWIPGFLFTAVAASGLSVDLLKIVFGRARPKLLFSGDEYGFTGIALRSDHWSFPSGHAATTAALVTALWCLWPQHVLFYLVLGALVAISRVVTGAHYLSDVVMGAALAIVVTRTAAAGFARGLPGWGRFPGRAPAPVLPTGDPQQAVRR